MNDMNFFAPLITSRDKGHQGSVVKILLVSVAILIVIVPILSFGYGLLLNSQISSMNKTLGEPSNAEMLQKLDVKQARLNSINESLPILQKKDVGLSSLEWITEKTLQVINDTMPKQVFMNISAMADRNVQLNGISVDQPAIAEMEYALRQSGIADDILVSNISKNEQGAYAYTINFRVKDVKPQ